MLLLVSQGELSTYGPGGRFGGLLYDQLGFKPADKDIKPNPHGQPVSFEYVSSKNQKLYLQWIEMKPLTVKERARKCYQTMY